MTQEKELRLSPMQTKVVKDLQKAYVLVTGNQLRGAIVSGKDGQYHIGSRVFWNLVSKGIIYQQIERPFNYILTAAGKLAK